jgi:hypothetical protein
MPSAIATASSCFSLVVVALAAGCAQVDSPNPEVVLPVDYRTTFVEVRGCRPSLDHMTAIVVRAPPDLTEVYDHGPYPFRTGALLVNEQYRDLQCMDLAEYNVMKKREDGYDPAAADWQWYRLDDRQHVIESGKITRCASCHLSCGGMRDRACTDS